MRYFLFLFLAANAQSQGFRLLDNAGNSATLESASFNMAPITAKFDAVGLSTASLQTQITGLGGGSSMKAKKPTDQVFYSSAALPVNLGTSITGLSFSLATKTSYYFEFDINHTSTATATGVWFGMTYPAGSTITWTVTQAITLASASTFMSRGIEFASAAGASVDAVNSPVPAKLYGTIQTNGAGTLQPRVKSELQNGRGSILSGSRGVLVEQ